MLTPEETEELISALKNSRPKKMLEHFDKDSTGIMCVLGYLHEIGRPVTAGEISTHMNVSTARVAVLIRKMESKKLIDKKTDPNDARKTIISNSDSGKVVISEHKKKMFALFTEVVENVGIDKFRQFIQLSDEIKTAVEDAMEKVSSKE